MKKIFVVFLLCIGWHSLLAQEVCGTDEMMRQLMKDDPSLKVRMEQYDERIRQHISNRQRERVQNDAQNPYIIHVVVHVVKDGKNGDVDNTTSEQIEAAITNMNSKYAGTGIQFKSAMIIWVDASTNPAYANNGVNHPSPNPKTDGINDDKLKNLSRWTPDLFYNIWVVNKIDGEDATHHDGELIDGYAQRPGVSENKDGMVILASSMKDPTNSTLSHEIGHALGLYHVFEGEKEEKDSQGNVIKRKCPSNLFCSIEGDKVCDTDPVTMQTPSDPPRTGLNLCTNTAYKPDTEENIMSYSNARNLFTQGQIERMRAAIESDCIRRSQVGLPPNFVCNAKNIIPEIGKALSKYEKQIRSVVSIDPNEKVGITNNTAANHVNGAAPFSYNIYFENKNTATAPAQEVVIIDTLDQSKLDLFTFQLQSFGYGGSTKAYIPTGLTEYFVVDTLRRPGKPNLLVKTDAKLDTSKGILTWHFLSLDPQTRELVADPLDGFLPPNVISPQGEGYVSYSVAPKTSLTHGTAIKNKAFIYFDNNAPIVTNEFLNTLDKVNPVSSVNPMPEQVYDTSFTVQWNGSDNGAGIRSYDVYYKVNNGEYKLWQYDVSLLSNEFPGQKDSTYSFFSISKDYAGNIESAKTTAERIVTVRVYDSSNTACAGAITKIQATPAGAGFTYHWQVNQGTGFVDILNNAIYSGITTTELTLTAPPTSYTNYQYRCKITNGTVTYYSSKHAVRFTNTWLGTTGTAWETPANWSCGVVPDENTHVIIPNAVPHNPILNANGTCKSLTMTNTSNLLIKSGANLIITGKLNN